uniref:Secreted Kazal protein n=1 Tax=Pristhesancus plagipennis TaxID=1955184 RepID=A0A2K8JUP2_PRIPG|nr:secreted Kazal protein [Pristhesancus plagipennis]
MNLFFYLLLSLHAVSVMMDDDEKPCPEECRPVWDPLCVSGVVAGTLKYVTFFNPCDYEKITCDKTNSLRKIQDGECPDTYPTTHQNIIKKLLK